MFVKHLHFILLCLFLCFTTLFKFSRAATNVMISRTRSKQEPEVHLSSCFPFLEANKNAHCLKLMFAHLATRDFKEANGERYFSSNKLWLCWLDFHKKENLQSHDESLILPSINHRFMEKWKSIARGQKKNNSQPIIKALYGTVETF